MTEALLRMKATLTQESHASRRGADAEPKRGRLSDVASRHVSRRRASATA